MAHAQSSDALLNKLVSKGVLTQQEADDLKKESDAGFDKAYRTKTGLPDWVTQLKIYGDVRGRWDFIKTDNDAPGASEPNKDRSRFRYRLRVGATAQFKENFEMGFRLTSSEANADGTGGDPISGNSTFQNNGSKKFIYIDTAYGKWTPINSGPWLLSGTVGKMENPFVVSDMVFDPDYTPEGFALQSGYNINKNHSLKLNAGIFFLDEISQGAQASNDPLLYGAQLRYDAKWSDHISSTIGLAWLGISDEQNLNNAAVNNGNVGNTRYPANVVGGQTIHTAGDLVEDFNPVVVDASVTYTLDKLVGYKGAFPIRVGGEYMNNPGADEKNDAYWLGVFFGKSGKKGTWELSYRYKRQEADSWYEEFVDSDTGAYRQVALGGSGQGAGYRSGTGVKGHVIKAAYSPSDSFTIGVTYYLYELIDTPRVTSTVGGRTVTTEESAAHRVLLDATWKF